MNATIETRKSAAASRLVKGDVVAIGAECFEVQGYPERIDSETVKVPMKRLDGTNQSRNSRKRFSATQRFTLIK